MTAPTATLPGSADPADFLLFTEAEPIDVLGDLLPRQSHANAETWEA